jgi:predicted O-methyltransferase YrrM
LQNAKRLRYQTDTMARKMTPKEVRKIIGDVPHMSLAQGERLTRLIHENQLESILELGTAHGVSTCYFAAALAELGRGAIVTIDFTSGRNRSPSVDELIERCGYTDLVSVYRDPTSYTWQLMKFLREDPTPRFDLCYFDGAHNWFVDGFAFFLVDRLLKTGGWIVFDDLDWTFAASPALRDTSQVRNMPADERETPQIKLVYDLLVKPHPSYGDFAVEDGWAFARKLPESARVATAVRTERVYVKVSLLSQIEKRIRRLIGG